MDFSIPPPVDVGAGREWAWSWVHVCSRAHMKKHSFKSMACTNAPGCLHLHRQARCNTCVSFYAMCAITLCGHFAATLCDVTRSLPSCWPLKGSGACCRACTRSRVSGQSPGLRRASGLARVHESVLLDTACKQGANLVCIVAR